MVPKPEFDLVLNTPGSFLTLFVCLGKRLFAEENNLSFSTLLRFYGKGSWKDFYVTKEGASLLSTEGLALFRKQ